MLSAGFYFHRGGTDDINVCTVRLSWLYVTSVSLLWYRLCAQTQLLSNRVYFALRSSPPQPEENGEVGSGRNQNGLSLKRLPPPGPLVKCLLVTGKRGLSEELAVLRAPKQFRFRDLLTLTV